MAWLDFAVSVDETFAFIFLFGGARVVVDSSFLIPSSPCPANRDRTLLSSVASRRGLPASRRLGQRVGLRSWFHRGGGARSVRGKYVSLAILLSFYVWNIGCDARSFRQTTHIGSTPT